MTLNFSDLTGRVRAQQSATADDLREVLTASPAATFALIEFAAELRNQHFGQLITVTNLLGVEGASPVTDRLELAAPLEFEGLVGALHDLSDREGALALDFVVGSDGLMPMEALRIIAAARLAAPEKSLHLGPSRELALRSLQPLALGAVDSVELTVDATQPGLVFEDLKLIVGAGFTIAGAGVRDLVAEYTDHLRTLGVEDADVYAQVALADSAGAGGGCGGNCACGSGGCG